MLEGVPEIGWSVPRVLGNARFIEAPVPAAPTRAAFMARNARAAAAIASLTATDQEVIGLSIGSELCTPVRKASESLCSSDAVSIPQPDRCRFDNRTFHLLLPHLSGRVDLSIQHHVSTPDGAVARPTSSREQAANGECSSGDPRC